MPDDLQRLIEPVRQLARRAGQRILEIYNTDFSVAEKADQSPLTEADMASHRTIVDGLTRLTPDCPILSEESSDIPFEERTGWSEYWLVDPLDGTREFINRNGEFTVNIALIRGHQPVLGVVHVPAQDTDYFACQRSGAYVQRAGGDAQPIHVSAFDAGCVRVVGSRSHRGDSLDRFLANLGPHQMVPMGSSIKLCLVAEGKADVYPRLGPTSEWDTAAAQAVVECAGGQVTDIDGRPLRYNTKATFLNPSFLVFGDASHDWKGCL
jgi:3'(2'), 5'-bisphosphate nucleotidase